MLTKTTQKSTPFLTKPSPKAFLKLDQGDQWFVTQSVYNHHPTDQREQNKQQQIKSDIIDTFLNSGDAHLTETLGPTLLNSEYNDSLTRPIGTTSRARAIFLKAAEKNPSFGAESFCQLMTSRLSTENGRVGPACVSDIAHEPACQESANRIAHFLASIASARPELLTHSYSEFDSGRVISFYEAAQQLLPPQELQKLYGNGARPQATKLDSAVAQTSCTETQLKSALGPIFKDLKSSYVGATQFFGVNEKGCSLAGIIRKTGRGEFTYDQRAWLPGLQKKVFTFYSVPELVSSLMPFQTKPVPEAKTAFSTSPTTVANKAPAKIEAAASSQGGAIMSPFSVLGIR